MAPFRKGFFFTYSQKIGLLGLISLLSLGLAGIGIYQVFDQKSSILALSPDLPQEMSHSKQRAVSQTSPVVSPIDINLADSAQWASLRGIGPTLSTRILRFRKAKGGFHSVEEIRRVYGLRAETFEQIKANLFVDPATIPSSGIKKRKNSKAVQPALASIDLNLASAEDLKVLRGIGPVLSKRIVAYRKALGGFKEVSQLRNVYGLKQEVYEEIQAFLFIHPSSILPQPTASLLSDSLASNKRMVSAKPVASVPKETSLPQILDLNRADSASLVDLPGIGPWTASQIIRYRTKIGYFLSVSQLADIPRLTSNNFQRMAPYLKIVDTDQFEKRILTGSPHGL